jgi:hypothetical protein
MMQNRQCAQREQITPLKVGIALGFRGSSKWPLDGLSNPRFLLLICTYLGNRWNVPMLSGSQITSEIRHRIQPFDHGGVSKRP